MLSSCHGHEESQEQRIKKRFKFNFETRNKIRLYDSKTKTQKLKIKTCAIQIWKHIFIMLIYANKKYEKNVTKLCYKIVFKTNVEKTKGNERFYLYLYPFTNLTYISFQGGFYVMPIHGLIHDGQLRTCPSCLLRLMYVFRVSVRS